jgi:hypothetical protein
MKYIAPRNLTLASVCGLSIELTKGEPRLCPPGMHDELLALGCIPETEMPEPAEGSAPVAPTNLIDRYSTLCTAFEIIALRNERTDFNAVGVPHAAVLAKELGWTCNAKERDAAWAKWQNEIAPK